MGTEVKVYRIPETQVMGRLCDNCAGLISAERGETGVAPLMEVE